MSRYLKQFHKLILIIIIFHHLYPDISTNMINLHFNTYISSHLKFYKEYKEMLQVPLLVGLKLSMKEYCAGCCVENVELAKKKPHISRDKYKIEEVYEEGQEGGFEKGGGMEFG
jgi:hypothetical protein